MNRHKLLRLVESINADYETIEQHIEDLGFTIICRQPDLEEEIAYAAEYLETSNSKNEQKVELLLGEYCAGGRVQLWLGMDQRHNYSFMLMNDGKGSTIDGYRKENIKKGMAAISSYP